MGIRRKSTGAAVASETPQPATPGSNDDIGESLRQLSAAAPDEPLASLNQDPQLLQDFLVESREHLVNIEARLLEIEHGQATPETLHSAFRSFHTMKGLAGFLDFEVIQQVSHEVETLLDLARNGQLVLQEESIEVVLASGDYLRLWLDFIEEGAAGRKACQPPGHASLIARVQAAATETVLDDAAAMEALAAPALSQALSTPPAQALAVQADLAGTAPGEPAGLNKPRQESSMVKVDTQKLEYLVDMVGELVIAQSMLKHNPDLNQVKSPRLQRDVAHLARVTADVQKTAMAMRMVPIGQLFRRMTRLVRDLSKKNGKPAELELFGEDVELDRTIVEELADPLVHMIRNSMDHGLEDVGGREAAGKPAAGKIRLKASHQAGQIVIEIGDDGRGLNRQRILDKAISRGLIERDRNLTDAEVWQLIFEPGFSTAEKVTDVSGRGVGMDVVRKHIHKLRGRIDITSAKGAGTTFLLKLPLTLAIIDGLIVVIGKERFIVPIFAVREMFKATPEMVFSVEGKNEMALVRERLLPVIRLADRMGIEARSVDACDGLMIVGESQERQFCLLVDELAGKQEVVIKSLGATFQGVKGIAGGAILGDGRVGLILDLATLASDCNRTQAAPQ